MKIRKLTSFFIPVIVSLLAMIGMTGCSDDDEDLQAQYGYVQFKLFKSASFNEGSSTRAVDQLTYLADAQKIEVVMQHDGSTISQTLVLNSYNTNNAEFGLRSDKLQLLAGDYTIVGYYIYDKLDQQLLSAVPESDNKFSVVSGGLIVKELPVNTVARGMVSFKLIKEFVNTRSEAGAAYPFSNIKAVDITVRNVFTQEVTEIKKIQVSYDEDFKDTSADEDMYPGKHAETSYATCDTVVWLKAGNYQISGYSTYSDKNATMSKMLETATVTTEKTFTVTDNKETKDVEVPIRLSQTAEYIKDYLALREIWEALDGPNWSYYGEVNPMGCNWNFNKDIDMWGDQPGVSLNADGRVETLVISGFNPKGVVPDAIGQLTELTFLSLGTHDELVGGSSMKDVSGHMTDAQKQALRMDYDTRFLARDGREGLSEPLKNSINNGIYPGNPAPVKNSRISLKDVQFGNLTNGITGISKAIMRLTKLQQFFLANSPITSDNFFREVSPESPFYAERNTWSWENFTTFYDVEIYNCPNLTRLPMEMLGELPEVQSLNIAFNRGISGEQLKKDWEDFIDYGKACDKLQLLYLGYNNLVEFPDYDHLKRMTKLSMLDCVYNKLEKVHPFGKEINLVKFYLDHNNLTEIPVAEDGYFFGYTDVESFTCSNNKLKLVPDAFNAKSVYVMQAVDFSYNEIEGFENGDNHRGINANSIDLSYNKLETFPGILFKTASPISTLMLAGNGMKEIPEGSLQGKYSYMLQSLDLSYNNLTKLPGEDFYATNLTYLYGIDLSYNSFSSFPTAPLNVATLTTFVIRHQRDANGNRTLREWPTGLYTCPSLVAFYIGSNDLRKIDDTISPYIRVFEIKDNPNISITLSSTVCSYIQAGYYTLVYDKTQDIRGCDILDLEK